MTKNFKFIAVLAVLLLATSCGQQNDSSLARKQGNQNQANPFPTNRNQPIRIDRYFGIVQCEPNQGQISVEQFLVKRSVKVGKIFYLKLTIRNHTDKLFIIYDIEIPSIPGNIRVAGMKSPNRSRYGYFDLRPRQQAIVKLRFLALKSGIVKSLVVRVIFAGEGSGTNWYYALSRHTISKITVNAIRLPGMEFPLTSPQKFTDKFFNLFAIKVIGIALLLSAICYGFGLAVNSNLVYYPLKRIGIGFLMSFTVSAILPLIYKGLIWAWRTTPPSLSDFIFLITVSTIITIRIRFQIIRNVIIDSLLSGFLLSLLSYLIYVGFKAYEHNGFEGLSLTGILAFGSVLGLAANGFFLRKE
jgi:hypothetical protein